MHLYLFGRVSLSRWIVYCARMNLVLDEQDKWDTAGARIKTNTGNISVEAMPSMRAWLLDLSNKQKVALLPLGVHTVSIRLARE